MIRQTSLESYIRLDEAKLGELQGKVYSYIREHKGVSDREISNGLSMTINCTTARRNELLKMGFIQEAGLKYDNLTKRKVLTWRVK